MHHYHLKFAKALSAGCGNIILPYYFQHAGARHSCYACGAVNAQRYARQNNAGEGIEARRRQPFQLYAEKQCNLTDLEACEESAADLTAYGIGDEIIGVLEIPAMELTMPVYLGASDAHLASGAAVLGNTSAPIGGDNTNCVIAGHRGWRGADYFRHIDRLQVGDTVTLTNLWETLTYTVSDIQIIQPHEVEKIKIQQGRDLLTLLTCHPYASGGRQRYVVYCERVME